MFCLSEITLSNRINVDVITRVVMFSLVLVLLVTIVML